MKVYTNWPWNPSRFKTQCFWAKQISGQVFVALFFLSSNTFICIGGVLGTVLQLQRLGGAQTGSQEWSWNPQHSFPTPSEHLDCAAVYFPFEIFSLPVSCEMKLLGCIWTSFCFLKGLSFSSCPWNKKFSRILSLDLYFCPAYLSKLSSFTFSSQSINMMFFLFVFKEFQDTLCFFF